MATTSKIAQRLAQLAVCHATEIALKGVVMSEACVCCGLECNMLAPWLYLEQPEFPLSTHEGHTLDITPNLPRKWPQPEA